MTDAAELPLLDARYNVFLGGTPPDLSPIPQSTASEAPYIGCMRDFYVGGSAPGPADFNAVPYQTGLELGECKSELAPATGGESAGAEDTATTAAPDGTGSDAGAGGDASEGGDGGDGADGGVASGKKECKFAAYLKPVLFYFGVAKDLVR